MVSIMGYADIPHSNIRNVCNTTHSVDYIQRTCQFVGKSAQHEQASQTNTFIDDQRNHILIPVANTIFEPHIAINNRFGAMGV